MLLFLDPERRLLQRSGERGDDLVHALIEAGLLYVDELVEQLHRGLQAGLTEKLKQTEHVLTDARNNWK